MVGLNMSNKIARYMTSSTLVESAKLRALLPETQITFREEDFLRFANEEMDTAVMPYVMSFHEDYFLFEEDVPLENNVNAYDIPYRAIGNKLRDVGYMDTGRNLYEMTRVSVEDMPYYQTDGNVASNSPIRSFMIRNNEVVLSPEIGFITQGFLRMYYYIRPNQLVSEDRVMVITNINRTTGQISVDKTPELYNIGTLVDLIQVKSPHKCLKIDISVTNVDTVNNIISIDPSSIPSKLRKGDHIALAEECMIPQLPTDIHSMLAQRIACRCLEALGDQQGLAAANAKLAEMELKLGAVVDNRVEGAPLKVVNRHSMLRNSRKYFRR